MHQFKALLVEATLPEKTGLHALWHFAATNLLGDAASIRDTIEALGHTHASTRLNIYAHALPERKHSVVNGAVNELFQPPAQPE